MDWNLFIGIAAGILVCAGLLFLSMIHLFMIPKDVMDRDTKPRTTSSNAKVSSAPAATEENQPPVSDETYKS